MPTGIYLRTKDHNKHNSEAKRKNPIRYWLGKQRSEMIGNNFAKGHMPWNKSSLKLKCKACDQLFHVEPALFNKRKYCSKLCYFKGMLGRIPWNKGKPNPKTAEWMKKNWKYIRSFQTLEGRVKGILNYWNRKGLIRRNPELREHHNHDLKYRRWRNSIFQRDRYQCQKCGAQCQKDGPVYLEAHHIKGWIKFPELRYEEKNGITLCKACHLFFRTSLEN